MVKTLRKIGIQENFLNLMKSIYKISTVNIFNGEWLNASLKMGNKTWLLAHIIQYLLAHIIQYLTEVLAGTIKSRERNKKYTDRSTYYDASIFSCEPLARTSTMTTCKMHQVIVPWRTEFSIGTPRGKLPLGFPGGVLLPI